MGGPEDPRQGLERRPWIGAHWEAALGTLESQGEVRLKGPTGAEGTSTAN